MDRSWRLGGNMAGNTSGKRKLFEQPLHTLFILLNGGVDLGGRRLIIKKRHHGRSAMPRTADVTDVEVIYLNGAIKVHVDEVQPRSRTPVSHPTSLELLE